MVRDISRRSIGGDRRGCRRGGGIAGVPSYHRLSFRRGTILSARFAPDGQTVVYGASWDGDPFRVFSPGRRVPSRARFRCPTPRSLELAVRPDGDLARPPLGGALHLEGHAGAGGARRRRAAGASRRRPMGGLGAGRHSSPSSQGSRGVQARVPDRERALRDSRLDQPSPRLAARRSGGLPGSSGPGRRLRFRHGRGPGEANEDVSEGWTTAYGLAWSPDGREVLFTATRVGVSRAIWAVTLSGRERLMARTPGELTIQDIDAGRRMLMTSDNGKVGIVELPPGQSRERDLSVLDWSLVRDISPDGSSSSSTSRARARLVLRGVRPKDRWISGGPSRRRKRGRLFAGRALGAGAEQPEEVPRAASGEGGRCRRKSRSRVSTSNVRPGCRTASER